MRGRGRRLVVDPTACDGYGSCAELLPEWIATDEWGYPIVPRGALPDPLLPLARRAVKACPRLALSLLVDERARTRA
ncbi:MAG TPA: ferredoxin [Acidimicrobiales bacterium]|nr:ferredoxin [Acidimicrobiales bacterium]